MPVTPAVIRWAREQAGIPLADARESFGDIEEWESGSSQPTYGEIEQLADQYKVPIAVFFFPEPPDIPPIPESFRPLPSDEFNDLPSKIRPLVRRAQAYQLDIEELYRVQRTERRSMLMDLSFGMDTPIHEMARTVRNYLGVPIEDQFQWRDSSHAMNAWRSAFFRSRVFVIKDHFPDSGLNGFCLYDRLNPLICVNSEFKYEYQIVTLLEALSSLLHSANGIDVGDDAHIDGMCLDFACEALIPSTEAEKYLGRKQATEQAAATLASRFHVSPHLIFRRFRNSKLISEATYQSAIIKWNSQRGIENVPNSLYERMISIFGHDYVGLVLSRHHADRINEEQVAEFLGIRMGDLEAFVSCYERHLD